MFAFLSKQIQNGSATYFTHTDQDLQIAVNPTLSKQVFNDLLLTILPKKQFRLPDNPFSQRIWATLEGTPFFEQIQLPNEKESIDQFDSLQYRTVRLIG